MTALSMSRGWRYFLVLAAVGLAVTSRGVAQHLTVDPHALATVGQNPPAGEYALDGTPQPNTEPSDVMCGQGCYNIASTPMVYVPQQCAGEHRCPLLIISNAPKPYYYLIADKYGMIVAFLVDMVHPSDDTEQLDAFDQGLQQILRSFAIDPDRIALLGRCATGQQTVDYADANPNLFSRILVGTQHTGRPPAKAPGQTTEYFIAGGLLENVANFWGVRRMRDRGYTVTLSFQFRDHGHAYEEYDFMGRWLQQSWAIPDPAARPVPYTVDDPPLLTAAALAHMTAFWTQFLKEPDSIQTAARRAWVREVLVSVGKERISTLMTDMPALAAKYAPVAAALKAAGLTSQQHEAYRAALAAAVVYRTTLAVGASLGVPSDSVRALLGITPAMAVVKNLEFMDAHPDELQALEATHMWSTP